MKFIKVTEDDTLYGPTPVLLNLDSISSIRMERNGDHRNYHVVCSGDNVYVDQFDYERILTALGIR